MSKSQSHTAPWRIREHRDGTYSVWTADDREVADSLGERIAKVVAAAPELLAACEYVAQFGGIALSGEQTQALAQRCRAAVDLAAHGRL